MRGVFKKQYRVLILDGSDDSKKASTLLRKNKIEISQVVVNPNDGEFTHNELPLLISGEGQWEGLEAVGRYVKSDKNRLSKH